MKLKQLEKNELRNVQGGLTYWFYGAIPFTVAKWLSETYERDLVKHFEPK